jgi:hypothetical protein
LKRLYVLFFVELERRRIWITGITANPDADWVTQQARNVDADLADANLDVKFLVRDRDTKVVASFDEVFSSQGARVLKTPVKAPMPMPMPMPTPKGSFTPSARNIWITFSSSVSDTCERCFRCTQITTTDIAHTRGSHRRSRTKRLLIFGCASPRRSL